MSVYNDNMVSKYLIEDCMTDVSKVKGCSQNVDRDVTVADGDIQMLK